MRLTYRALGQNNNRTGEVWYNAKMVKTGNSIYPQSSQEKRALEKLATYEDAEEQGLLVRLPRKVGDTVWFIKKTGFHPEIIETRIDEIGVRHSGGFIKLACNSQYRTAISALEKTIFMSREEAEAALKGESKDV